MSWFPVDDGFHSHPKARQAGDEAIGFWARAGSYSMAYLTDGFVPEWWVKEQTRGMVKAKRLVAAGLWTHPAEKDGEQGFQFHQWKHECTKAVVLAGRERARQRKAKSRESQQESQVESHRDIPRDERRESPDMSGPTQPNPTQLKDFSGQLPESATDSNARGSVAATPGADLVRRIVPKTFPDSDRTMLRIKASALLNEGISAADVESALRLWVDKPGIGPSVLPSLVSDVIKNRNGPVNGTNGKPVHKLRSIADLARETRADEQAQLEPITTRRELT